MRYTFMKYALVLGALLVAAGCQDLEVTYENTPGTEEALSTPTAVENVIAASFADIWWPRMHSSFSNNSGDMYNYYPEASGSWARTWSNRGLIPGQEPRVEFDNGPEAPTVWIPRVTWDGFASGLANANDGLRVILNQDMRIELPDGDGDDGDLVDRTDRATAWARLWQGINLGYMALTHDQLAPADETTSIGSPADWEGPNLTPYDEVMPMAIAHIERAIEIAETGDQWVTPDIYVNGQSYDNSQVVEFAHTMIARMLVLVARTPEERAAVDWAKVQHHAERGLTFDFGPELQSGTITSFGWIQRLVLNINNSAIFRVSPRVLGMADVSGNFLEWLATDLDLREGFCIESPDRRAVGPNAGSGDTPCSDGDPGSVFTTGPSIINPDRGTYLESFYLNWRLDNQEGTDWTSGFAPVAREVENRLYLAEAHLRQGNPGVAADLINESRMADQVVGSDVYQQDLEPVTADGVPQAEDCVPRARFGAAALGECGTLMDALLYERTIELMDLDPMRTWMDNRGFGYLPEGQLYHMPVPGRYLVSMEVPIYTFGGIGRPGSAEGYP